MEKSRKKNGARLEPGAIVKVPFGGHHTYARVLNFGDYAFYDFKTKSEVLDLKEIIARPILFRAVLNVRPVKEGLWTSIGILPLEPELQNSTYYWAGPVDPNQYRISENGSIRDATKEECIGLEVFGIWDPIHIEQRLQDHYAGREYVGIKMLDVLENYKRKK